MNIAKHRKEKVIQKIELLADDKLLAQIEALLNNVSDNTLFLQKYIKPIRKKTNIDALIKAKNYAGVNKRKIKSITETINIPQTTDELLLML